MEYSSLVLLRFQVYCGIVSPTFKSLYIIFARKIPWRLSKTRKLRHRRRLRKVDMVLSTLHTSLSKRGLSCHALERQIREITPESKMLPKDKYTVFDKKSKKFRKSIHFVPKVSNQIT